MVCLLGVVSCTSSRAVVHSRRYVKSSGKASVFSEGNKGSVGAILKDAEKYLGTPYKFGGSTDAGFDCSGFTFRVFGENNYYLPRRSAEQAFFGRYVELGGIRPGDLLFFATNGGRRVSHVGIVHSVDENGEIKFIHASTSKGVIISSLNQKYWSRAYLHARRVL